MGNLVKLRKEASISQLELAERLDVSQQTISKYENGNREPDNGTLIKLSEIFNCSTDYLLGRSNVHLPSNEILNILDNDPELAEFRDKLKKKGRSQTTY